MDEKEFQAEVIRLLQMNGFTKIYHTHDSRRSEPGFPDIVAIRPSDGYALFWELKTDKGKCSEAQCEWLEALDKIRRFNVAVRRPKDMRKIIDLVRDTNESLRAEAKKQEGER